MAAPAQPAASVTPAQPAPAPSHVIPLMPIVKPAPMPLAQPEPVVAPVAADDALPAAVVLSATPEVDNAAAVVDERKDGHDWVSSVVASEGGPPVAMLPPKVLPAAGSGEVPDFAYYAKTVEQVEAEFATSHRLGLNSADVPGLLEKWGVNALPKPSPPTKLEIFFGQFKDFLILLLCAVAVLEFGLQEWPEGGVLATVILLNVIVGYNQEVKAQKALDALDSLTRNSCLVIRDGQNQEVPSRLIVPGDAVVLEEGDLIPADLRMCVCQNLDVAEANLTGESTEITKFSDALPWNPEYPLPVADRKNMTFMSTMVVKGRGVGIVIATGTHTEVGDISSSLAEKIQSESPLKRKLRLLGYYLVGMSTFLCALVVGIGLLRIRADSGRVTSDDTMDMIKVGISLAVAVVPEGLVAVVTVTMALGVQRMAAKQAVMRHLPAVETLGSVTTICSDKTGTLTEGKMRLQYMWTPSLWGLAGPEAQQAVDDQLRRVESRARLMQPMQRPAGPGLLTEQRRKISLVRGDSFVRQDSSFRRGDSSLLTRGESTLRRGDSALRRGDSALRRGDSALLTRGNSTFLRRAGSTLGAGGEGGTRVVSEDLVDVMNVTRNQSRLGKWFLDQSMRQNSSLTDGSRAGSAANLAALTSSADSPVLEMVTVHDEEKDETDSHMPGVFSFTGKGIDPDGEMQFSGNRIHQLTESPVRAMMVCSLNNTSSLTFDLDSNQWVATGDSTEIPLEVAARKIGLGRENWLSSGAVSQHLVVPFDSDRQRMSMVYLYGDGSQPELGGVVLVKGSFDSVMVRCSRAQMLDGTMPGTLHEALQKTVGVEIPNDKPAVPNTVQPLTEELRQRIRREELALTSQGLRVLTLAYRDSSTAEIEAMSEHDPESIERDLVFCGLVAIRDPPREEAKLAIARAHSGGIRVCMITGDHASTAMAIGESLGMVTADQQDMVITGRELDQMSPEELQARQPFPVVFARVTPAHKLLIVNSLKAQGNVVAMTGDGVNDSPAIKHSDCGIAMGITGTDLTKQSADMVLLNDNFASIVDAIEEGRLTFDNIRKFVLYLLTCNSSYIYIMLVTVAAGLASPFTPIMVLWANVVVDVLPALALGVDPPSPDIMHRKPRDPKSGVLSGKGVIMLVCQGVLMSGLTLAAYLIGLGPLDYPEIGKPNSPRSGELVGQARTLAFVALAVQHVFQAYHSRSPTRSLFNRDWNDNKLLLMGASFSLLLMAVVIYIPGLNEGLNLEPLGGYDWLIVIGVILLQALGNELIKMLLVRGLYGWLLRRDESKNGEPLFYRDI